MLSEGLRVGNRVLPKADLMRMLTMNCMIALMLLASVTASAHPAQTAQGPRGMAPADFRGVFNPTVGLGAAYQLETGGNPIMAEMEITVIGKQTVDGKQGYWIEFGALGQQRQLYMKMLVLVDGNNISTTRSIIQSSGTSAVELPLPGTPQTTPADNRENADKIGTESVTTPAGTFNCDHYRAKDGSWDEWLSPKVGPWGLVKTVSKGNTMTLTRIVSNATDHITGSPPSTK
jgi:hypothetical protein